MKQPTTNQIASLFGCSEAQVRAQFAKNAAQLEAMAAKAESTGRKVNNYTAAQLREMAAKARAKA